MTILVIVALVCYLMNNQEDFSVLIHIPPIQLAGLVLFSMAASVINGLYMKVLVASVGKRMDIFGWLGVKSIGGLINSVLPLRGGTVFEAFYYKRVYTLNYSSYISFSAGNTVVSLLGQLITFTGVFAMLSFTTGEVSVSWVLLMFLLLVASFIALFILLKYRGRILKYIPFKKYLLPIIEGFLELFEKKKTLWQLSILFATSLTAIAMKYMVCFWIAEMPVRFSIAFLYGAVTILLSFCALLPGNWGITELVLGALTFILGDAFNNGILLSLLGRLGAVIGYFFLTLVFAYPLYRKVKGIQTNE